MTVRDAGDRVALAVSDRGPGLPAELLEQSAKGPVSPGPAARRARTASLGVGLYIVQAVARAHRGTLRVEKAPGRATFTIELPRVCDAAAPGPRAAA